ncbi:hypothetical protein TNCT_454651 [Trichonephila clavata]|uniref:Uncharacterized protein n=1 Tax=Trichonephila clavata TaxID=2740835 RepID=A0A8X6IA13_TRICU|nr:hypothetical protein TNCT_454651 [Trichonephila clavata]
MPNSWRCFELAFGSFHRQTSHKRPSWATSRSLLFSSCFDAIKCVFWPVPRLVTQVRSVRGMGTLRKMLLLLFSVIGSGRPLLRASASRKSGGIFVYLPRVTISLITFQVTPTSRKL